MFRLDDFQPNYKDMVDKLTLFYDTLHEYQVLPFSAFRFWLRTFEWIVRFGRTKNYERKISHEL